MTKNLHRYKPASVQQTSSRLSKWSFYRLHLCCNEFAFEKVFYIKNINMASSLIPSFHLYLNNNISYYITTIQFIIRPTHAAWYSVLLLLRSHRKTLLRWPAYTNKPHWAFLWSEHMCPWHTLHVTTTPVICWLSAIVPKHKQSLQYSSPVHLTINCFSFDPVAVNRVHNRGDSHTFWGRFPDENTSGKGLKTLDKKQCLLWHFFHCLDVSSSPTDTFLPVPHASENKRCSNLYQCAT